MDIYSQLRRDEGVRQFVYNDSMGIPTIGVGRNLRNKGLSDDEIDFLLSNDVHEVESQLDSRLPWYQGIDAVRKAVLINMAFNMGFKGLDGFPLFLRAMAQGDWETASAEMLDSLWAKQVGDRATRLAQQIKTGEWQ